MRVSVVLEQRFSMTPDGRVWTKAQFPYAFWRRYLDVFDTVNVVARTAHVETVQPDWIRADGPSVSVTPIPWYLGVKNYLAKRSEVASACCNAVQPSDAVSLRLGSTLAMHVAKHLRRQGGRYGVEVVSDPWDALAPGSISHPLRPALRWYLFNCMAALCRDAAAACYVTEHHLQTRYPVARGTPQFHASDVSLSAQMYRPVPRQYQRLDRVRLLFVGSLSQRYKGLHILLEAMRTPLDLGVKIHLHVVGDGVERKALEEKAKQLGLATHVSFLGELATGNPVMAALDNADILVMPSLTEGLPRALLEAMARALPCIGSDAGGIPELLSPEAITPKGDVTALGAKLCQFVRNPRLLTEQSELNLKRAHDFEESCLRPRWLSYCGALLRRTTNAKIAKAEAASFSKAGNA